MDITNNYRVNNETNTIVDEIIKQNTENNNIINLDGNMINYIHATVFDKIDDIIKENPDIEHVLKNNKQVIAMIDNNISKKLAYTKSFSQIVLLILMMYNNALKKNNKDCNKDNDSDDSDIPGVAVD